MSGEDFSRDNGDKYLPGPELARPAGKWLKLFEDTGGPLAEVLQQNYGDRQEVLEARRRLYSSALTHFINTYGGERDVYLLAAPSRINWEGHHVDHQGGYYNSTTHAREVVAVCGPREDDRVEAANVLWERFPPVEFSLTEGEPVSGDETHWADYVKGGFLAAGRRLGAALKGADLVLGGDIPVGAGLSSSHALVLCGVLSSLASAGAELPKPAAVACVQEGEWFTGSRTGLGDQATMIFGKRDRLFFGRVLVAEEILPRYAELPPDILRVMINSYAEHSLHGKERLGYNSRVFAYKAAFPLLVGALEECGIAAEDLETVRCLADISPRHIPTETIYRALRMIPAEFSLSDVRRRIKARFPEYDLDALVKTYFGDDEPADRIRVRGIALYGLAECHRSELFGPLIQDGKIRDAGALAVTGHNGDRVVERNSSGVYRPVSSGLSDEDLERLIADRTSGDQGRVERASLATQPGEYRASIRELDELVDIALDAGSISASLTGGGLGGCVTCFLDRAKLPDLRAGVMEFYEREEAAELEWLTGRNELEEYFPEGEREAVREAVRIAHHRKQDARREGAVWQPGLEEEKAFDMIRRAARAYEEARDEPPSRKLQYLQVDYAAEGIQENVSVAGAGYLPAGAA
jgi:galactokinase